MAILLLPPLTATELGLLRLRGYSWPHPAFFSCVSSGDPNWGPQACTVSAFLPWAISPAQFLYFLSVNRRPIIPGGQRYPTMVSPHRGENRHLIRSSRWDNYEWWTSIKSLHPHLIEESCADPGNYCYFTMEYSCCDMNSPNIFN